MRKSIESKMFLSGVIAVAGIVTSAVPATAALKKNIVLIMTDDMGYECIGAYGSTYSTPNLDRMAKAGVMFNHCYSTPLCSPSRNEIMTGKYNNRNYVAFGYMDPDQKTFGNIFQDAGYATCIAGKWQLGNSEEGIQNFGFDEYCVWNMKRYYRQSKNKSSNKNGAKRPIGKRYWGATLYQTDGMKKYAQKIYGPDICTDFIMEFIEDNKAKPFLVYYPSVLVHDPFPKTPDTKVKGKGTAAANFGDMCSYSDKLVGKIEAKLKELGLMENTVIIFTGDNGTNLKIKTPMKDGSSVKGGKGLMTDGGTRVPLIAYGAGIKSGIKSNSMVDFSDILPTITDIAGIPLPNGFYSDGVSFNPVLTGKKESVKNQIFCYYDSKWGKFKKSVWARTKEYKLYSNGEFYNVPQDVFEKKPLISLTERQKAIKKQLQDVLDEKMKTITTSGI